MDNSVKALFAIADELKKIRRVLEKQQPVVSNIRYTPEGIQVNYDRKEEMDVNNNRSD